MARIFVIGGAGGVGSAVVAKLLARGDRVSITVLNSDEENLARKATPGVDAIHHVDLSDPASARSTLESAFRAAGPVDSVITCAAMGPVGPLETADLNVIRRTLDVNCVSHIAIFQAALPALRETKGRLLFISSMAGKTGMPFIGAYTASKFALEGAADVMRQEAAPQGVKVVLVEPGGIKTPMVDGQLAQVANSLGRLDADEERRYGYLYRGFHAMASAGQEESSSTPEQIADILIAAHDDPHPSARYAAGADAEQMIALAKQGDAIVDETFRSLFAQHGGSPG